MDVKIITSDIDTEEAFRSIHKMKKMLIKIKNSASKDWVAETIAKLWVVV